jgi:hypothetical protein
MQYIFIVLSFFISLTIQLWLKTNKLNFPLHILLFIFSLVSILLTGLQIVLISITLLRY